VNAPAGSTAPAELVHINGRDATQVSALDRGLHYGEGLFETIACTHGTPRLLELHLKRLGRGCARLGFTPPPVEELAAEVHAFAAPRERAVVKLIVTRGVAQARGYARGKDETVTRITLRYPWPAEDATLAHKGVRVRIGALRLGENPALAGLKHCNRLEQVLARAEWSDPAIAEALLYSSSGALVSGTMSNVFLVLDSKLVTPRLHRCGVAGVMRELLLTLAPGAGIAAEERDLTAADLARASEIFLTNALIGIRPVRELGGHTLAVGGVTRALQALVAPRLNLSSTPAAGGRR
jgi:4-amino-4-deoxychorismate lyase